MKTGITGPMWSGKTYQLLTIIQRFIFNNDKNKVLAVMPPGADRKNGRDLPQIADIPVINFAEKIENNFDLVIFDEVHLYEVLGKLDMFLESFYGLKNVIVCGLYNDSYNNYQVFNVWQEITPFLDEILVMKSRKPCELCGKEAFFSTHKKNKENKVGDHYINVCIKHRGR